MFIFLLVFLIFTILLLFVITSAFLGFLFTRVPYITTDAADIPELVERLAIASTDTVYELGSGNGKVAFLIEQHAGAKVHGFEATLWTHLWAELKKIVKRSKADFVYGNFYNHSWSDATVMYMYLYPSLMPVIAKKALAECAPGTRLVSRDFAIHTMNKIDEYTTKSNHTIYVYQV
jgi:hypothetical protein